MLIKIIIIAGLVFFFTCFDIRIEVIEDDSSDDSLDYYLHKPVNIVIRNNGYFASKPEFRGEILDYDDDWLIVKYFDDCINEYVKQFIRMKDLVRVEEL